MAACGSCGSTILFGGASVGNAKYCNAKCARSGQLLALSNQIPNDVVHRSLHEVYRGMCPHCKGPGPVDVHQSYRVYSLVLMTRWENLQKVSCRRCGVKTQLGNMAISLVAGWWGFPWGLIMTPVQIGRNISAMLKGGQEDGPSPKLERAVRISLAGNAIQQQAPSPSAKRV